MGRTSESKDVDIYCRTKVVYEELVARMKNMGEVTVVKFDGDLTKGKIDLDIGEVNAPELHDYVQVDLILRECECIEELLEGFDMNWCMVGLDLANWQVIYHPDFLLDKLIFNLDAKVGNSAENDVDISVIIAERRMEKYALRRSLSIDMALIKKKIEKIVRARENDSVWSY